MTALWSFNGEDILRHSEAGAIAHHIRTARSLLERGELPAEHLRQLRAAVAAYEAAQPAQLTPEDIDAALAERRLEPAL